VVTHAAVAPQVTHVQPSVGRAQRVPLATHTPTSGGVSPAGAAGPADLGPTSSGPAILEFTLPAPNSQPTAIAAGPDGNPWFSEYANVGRIQMDGTLTEYAIPPNLVTGPASGLTTGPDGNVWLTSNAELAPTTIGKLTPGGALTAYSSSQPPHPGGIVAGPDGNLWFALQENIGRITPSGALSIFGVAGSHSSIAAGPDGNLWFDDYYAGKIGRITPAGGVAEFDVPGLTPGSARVHGLTAGPDGNLWFTGTGLNAVSYGYGVGRITPGGAVTEYPLPETVIPKGITVAADGALWFTEQDARLGRITTDGAFQEFSLPSATAAGAITRTPDGNLWFTDPNSNSVGVVVLGVPPAFAKPCDCGCSTSAGDLVQDDPAAASGAPKDTGDGQVRFADGTVLVAAAAVASAGFGVAWGQTHSWTNGPGYASGGANGVGGVDTQAPVLQDVYRDGSTLAAVSNGSTARYFDRQPDGSYLPRYNDQSSLALDPTTGDYVLTDSSGDRLRFAGFSANLPYAQRGGLKSYADPNSGLTQVTATAGGRPAEARRSTGSGSTAAVESWLYGYLPAGDPNAGLLQSVTLRRSADGGTTWTTVRQVNYAYYDGSQPYGNLGDLRTETVADAAGRALDTSYYRYYQAGQTAGYLHGLKFSFAPASYARLVAAVGDPTVASDDQVRPYADHYLEYDAAHRVTKEVNQGAGCSACSGGLGTSTYSYTASANAPGYNSWAMKTVETLPDGNQDVVYTNAAGEVMLSVYRGTAAGDPTNGLSWDTFSQYDGQGRVVLQASPSAVSGFDDSHADLLNFQNGSSPYLRNATGLLARTDYYGAPTTATETTPGGVAGYVQDSKLQQGQQGTPVLQHSWQYFAHTAVGGPTVRPFATDTVYRNSDGSGAETTSYSYTWYPGTAQVRSRTVSKPVISADPTAGQNGPGVPDVETTTYDVYGRPEWAKDADNYLHYTGYDPATGALALAVSDASNRPGPLSDADVGAPSPAGSASSNAGTGAYTLSGGAGIGGTADQFNFDYQSWTGDGTLLAQVSSLPNTNAAAQAGLMVRASLDANAAYALVDATPSAGLEFSRRTAAGATASSTTAAGAAPVWLKLTRRGNTLSASWSADGLNWSLLGSDSVVLPASVYVGLAVSSHVNGTPLSATFAGLAVGALDAPGGWVTPAGGGLNLVSRYQVDGLGRTTSTTDPNGHTTYTAYQDFAHLVATYPGWDAVNHVPTGPTVVRREDRGDGPDSSHHDGYVETFTTTAAPAVGANGAPTGGEFVDATTGAYAYAGAGLQTLARQYVNDAGQAVRQDAYFSFAAMSYAPTLAPGAVNTNYYTTQYGFDARGRPNKTVRPTGTLDRTVYDGLGRPVSTWLGAGSDDVPASGYWSPSNPAAMTQTAGYVYDGGGVGDGDLTLRTEYPSGNPNPANPPADRRLTPYAYDWRDRRVAEKDGASPAGPAAETDGVHRPILVTAYDNLGQATLQQRYDGDGAAVSVNADGSVSLSQPGRLRAQTATAYDDQGRPYRSQTFDVDPVSGQIKTDQTPQHNPLVLTTNQWYDHRGQLIKTAEPGGLVSKTRYDGAGRAVTTYTTDGGTDPSWAGAGNVAGDVVLSQMETTYDPAGNVLATVDRERFHDEVLPGALSDPAGGPNGTAAKARVSYAARYYDAADRPTAAVDVGTNAGTAWSRPDIAPAGSDTVLVSATGYNPAGWVDTVTDPRGLVTKDSYDNLGRLTQTVEDYGAPGNNHANKTTEYTYDGSGHVLTVQADLGGGAFERTGYVYQAQKGVNAAADSNDLLTAVLHPDKLSGLPSAAEQDRYTRNSLGEVSSATDRNGTTHQYTFDPLGRQTADAVTLAANSSVDRAVLRLETAYDGQGNAYLLTSYDAASGGRVVNQVLRQYNGLGQLTAEFQAHAGAVDTNATLAVRYAYNEMAGGANHSRPLSMTYPNGRVLHSGYNAGLDDRLSRLSYLADDDGSGGMGQHLEEYSYLGLGTLVQQARPQPGVGLSYVRQPGQMLGDAGDPYTGLDRFGRVVDQRWAAPGAVTPADEHTYGYDRDGNRLSRTDVINATFSEGYQYDGLNQLTGFTQGPTHSLAWGLDAVGNWSTLSTDGGSAQGRAHNAQNQITSGGVTYAAAGNTTADGSGTAFAYDAWNRLVRVTAGSTTLAAYGYDALGRRVSEARGATTTDLYDSDGWQVLEERVGGQAKAQYVWGTGGIDALVLRDRDATGSGVLGERLYAMQDANGNVTALVGSNGGVAERYAYDPYGAARVLDAGYTPRPAGSAVGWSYLHQGLRLDASAGLYDGRARAYSPTLGRWLQNDPLGFAAGDANTYRYEGDNPADASDPSGLLTNNLEQQLLPDGRIALYYKYDRSYFHQAVTGLPGLWLEATKSPVFVGILDPDKPIVTRGGQTVPLEQVLQEARSTFTTSDWGAWFREKGQAAAEAKQTWIGQQAAEGISSSRNERAQGVTQIKELIRTYGEFVVTVPFCAAIITKGVRIDHILKDPLRRAHVFDPKHNLGPLGTEAEALTKGANAIKALDASPAGLPVNSAGVFRVVAPIEGHNVTITGRVISGEAIISNLWI
jgi:RHS repeat-associated protein